MDVSFIRGSYAHLFLVGLSFDLLLAAGDYSDHPLSAGVAAAVALPHSRYCGGRRARFGKGDHLLAGTHTTRAKAGVLSSCHKAATDVSGTISPDMTSKVAWFFFFLLSLLILSGCGGSAGGNSGGGTQGGSLAISLSNNAPLVFPLQANASINVTVTRTGNTGNVTLTVSGVPSTAVVTVQSPGTTNAG